MAFVSNSGSYKLCIAYVYANITHTHKDMHVSVFTCVSIDAFVHLSMCTFMCYSMCVNMCIVACKEMCVYVHTCMTLSKCVYISMYVGKHSGVCVHTHVYIL